jgi:hypothetical protein
LGMKSLDEIMMKKLLMLLHLAPALEWLGGDRKSILISMIIISAMLLSAHAGQVVHTAKIEYDARRSSWG